METKLDCDAAFDFVDTLQETTCRKLKSGLGYERTFEDRLVADPVTRWFADQGPAGMVTKAKRGA